MAGPRRASPLCPQPPQPPLCQAGTAATTGILGDLWGRGPQLIPKGTESRYFRCPGPTTEPFPGSPQAASDVPRAHKASVTVGGALPLAFRPQSRELPGLPTQRGVSDPRDGETHTSIPMASVREGLCVCRRGSRSPEARPHGRTEKSPASAEAYCAQVLLLTMFPRPPNKFSWDLICREVK